MSKGAKNRLPLRYKKTKKNKKKKNVKITMKTGLDIIFKFKYTTNFDRCATLNVLNCFTKKFESC